MIVKNQTVQIYHSGLELLFEKNSILMQNALFHCLNVWFGNMDHIKGFKLSVKYFDCDYLRIEKSGYCIGHKLGFFFSDPSFKTTVKHLDSHYVNASRLFLEHVFFSDKVAPRR